MRTPRIVGDGGINISNSLVRCKKVLSERFERHARKARVRTEYLAELFSDRHIKRLAALAQRGLKEEAAAAAFEDAADSTARFSMLIGPVPALTTRVAALALLQPAALATGPSSRYFPAHDLVLEPLRRGVGVVGVLHAGRIDVVLRPTIGKAGDRLRVTYETDT